MTATSKKRIGIFGGSFDPIHLGHLILAQHCLDQAELDEVLFIPGAVTPNKQDGPTGTDRQRVEMIDLAIAGHPKFRRSNIEIDRGGVSYTVDTLAQLTGEQPDVEWYFMIGDDSLESFASWREPAKILQLATPLVVNRPGHGDVDLSPLEALADPKHLARIGEAQVHSPMIEISSTDIRQRVAEGRSIRYLVPRAVEKYIQTQSMYI